MKFYSQDISKDEFLKNQNKFVDYMFKKLCFLPLFFSFHRNSFYILMLENFKDDEADKNLADLMKILMGDYELYRQVYK